MPGLGTLSLSMWRCSLSPRPDSCPHSPASSDGQHDRASDHGHELWRNCFVDWDSRYIYIYTLDLVWHSRHFNFVVMVLISYASTVGCLDLAPL